MKTEEWRAVVGYEGIYEVSNEGSVRVLGRVVRYPTGTERWKAGHILKLQVQKTNLGHRVVRLYRDSSGVGRLVHRLVLESFVGPAPTGMVDCHGDSDTSNNKLTNLRWDTPAGNEADKLTNGTSNRGERHGLAKLTEAQVIEIKKSTVSNKELAEFYGVVPLTISRIQAGKRWPHV